jgi:dihydrodipicolinate synthase/N-acetylneuraminate lyase
MSDATPLLRGIVVPLVTPLEGFDRLDVGALEALIEHVLDGGVHGLFLLGTCGEGPSLGYRLRRELVTRTCKQVRGRVPIVVGITDSSAVEAEAMAVHSAECGADAVVIAPPFYFPLDRNELIGFVRRRVQRSPLPVLLYNMPSLTKLAFEPEWVRQLMDEPKIIGFKDSSGDLAYFELLLSAAGERSDWSFLVGPEHLLVQSLQLGGHGGVSGGANIFPSLFVRIYELATDERSPTFERVWEQAMALGGIYECAGGGAASAVKGLKAAIASLGFGTGQLAEPLEPLPEQERARVIAIVAELNDSLEAVLAEDARTGQRVNGHRTRELPRVFPG